MHHPRVRILVVIVLLAVLGLGYGWWTSRASQSDGITASGMLESDRVVVASEVGARAAAVLVDRGVVVERGQDLVRLDDREVRLRQRQAAANGPEQQQLDLMAEKYVLHAPTDGVIAERAIEPGEVVQPGAPLLLIERPNQLRLVMYVSEQQIARVQVGQRVALTTDAAPGETFAAHVETIAQTAEFTPRNVQAPKDRALLVFAVWARVEQPDGRLKAGMPVDAVIVE